MPEPYPPDEPRYCAPVDFGDWHITVDGETTLCKAYTVAGHHISGRVAGSHHDPARDCCRCMAIYGHEYADAKRNQEA